MKRIILILLLFWTAPVRGDGLELEQAARLTEYLQKGTSREKILALSLLPKPRCGAQANQDSAMVLQAMTDSDPLVREMAVFYVRNSIGRSSSIPTRLEDPDFFEISPSLPEEHRVFRGFSRRQNIPEVCGSQAITDSLLKAATDTVPRVRMESAIGLGFTGESRIAPTLVMLSRDPDPFVRAGAAFALGELRAKDNDLALSVVATSLTGDWRDYYARREALKALRKIWVAGFRRVVAMGPNGNIPQEIFDENLRKRAVATALEVADDVTVRQEAFELLSEIKAPEAVAAFQAGAIDKDPVVRLSAIRGLLRLAGDRQACADCRTMFAAAVADTDARVRAVAINGMGRVAGKEPDTAIFKAFDDPDDGVRKAAVNAVRGSDSKSLEKLASDLNAKQEIRTIALTSLYRATRTDSDFESVYQKRRPAAAGPGVSYLRTDPNSRPKRVKAERPMPDEIMPHKRMNNETVVTAIIDIFPKLTLEEKAYALETLEKFDNHRIITLMIQSMKDPDWHIAVKAIEIAAVYAPQEAFPEIAKYSHVLNDEVRSSARMNFMSMPNSVALTTLSWMATAPEKETRKLYFEALNRYENPALIGQYLIGLNDSDEDVRYAAARFFVANPDSRALSVLISLLDKSGRDAVTAAEALGEFDDKGALEALLNALRKSVNTSNTTLDFQIRQAALQSLELMGNTDLIAPVVIEYLERMPDAPIAMRFIQTLGNLKNPRATPVLLKYVRENHAYADDALYVLGALGDPQSLDEIKQIIYDRGKPHRRRLVAMFALNMMAPEMIYDAIERCEELRPELPNYIRIYSGQKKNIARAAGRSPALYRDLLMSMDSAQQFEFTLKVVGSLLTDPDPDIVKGAILMLRASKDPLAVPVLQKLLKTDDHSLRDLILEAVASITANVKKPVKSE